MFILMLSRWYNTLRPRQKDVKQETMNLMMLKENEEKDEYSEEKQEISPWIATDSKILLSRVPSSTVPEVAKFSGLTNSRFRSDEINSDDDNDTDEFLSDYATPYGSINESEQHTSNDESPPTSAKRELQIVEESIVNGNSRKWNEKSVDSIRMKRDFVTKITSFMNTLDLTQQKQHEAVMRHEHINVLEKNEHHLQQVVPSLQRLSSLSAIAPRHDDESLTDSLLSYGTESASEAPKNSKSSRLAYSLESLATLLPSRRNPFLMLNNTQQAPNSYLHVSAPFNINCSEIGTSDNSNLRRNFYVSDTVLLPYFKASQVKNRFLYSVGMKKSSSTTGFECDIEKRLLGRKSEVRNEQFSHGLDMVLSVNEEGNMNANSTYSNLSSEPSFYDGDSSIHINPESAASDFGSYISICQNNIENTEFMVISDFNERIYDAKAFNLIPEDNNLFLSYYDTLLENGNDRETPLIFSSSGNENKTRETAAATTAGNNSNDDAAKLKKSKTFDGSISMGTHKLLTESEDAASSLTNSTKTFGNGVLQQNHPIIPLPASKSIVCFKYILFVCFLDS
ncbi:unnamed protein product [Onchocerca flexuosa]|uniref:Protein kinase domain-containing protein n=1 Tax=Onchocerca flexuosa TaxID=387005 RepID=A0A183H3K1_9BILA|nr:unnamed protein product [Onchocerca flexuosa]